MPQQTLSVSRKSPFDFRGRAVILSSGLEYRSKNATTAHTWRSAEALSSFEKPVDCQVDGQIAALKSAGAATIYRARIFGVADRSQLTKRMAFCLSLSWIGSAVLELRDGGEHGDRQAALRHGSVEQRITRGL